MNHFKTLKRFGLLLIGILTLQSAYSQENYIPGYVIKNKADTLFGLVDYRNWKYNPDQIKFKTTIENNPVFFYPVDITEFQVEGEIYVSGIINIEVSPRQTDNLTDDPQIITAIDTTFLQTLVRGEKSLYYYQNAGGSQNFYIKQEQGYDLLEYKRFIKQKDGKHVIAENKTYLGQLTLHLNDCSTINSKLENTSCKQKSLIALFQYYHECSSSDISFQKETEKIRAEIGVLAGASLTSLKLLSGRDAYTHLVEAGYNPSNNFSTGIFLDLILPKSQGKWSLNSEILFTTYEVEGNYEEFTNENYYSLTTTRIGYSYLKINNLIRFKYPVGHLFVILNGGISNGFSISETNHKRKESKFYTTERVTEELALNATRKHEQGLVLGTGVKYDRFSIEIRYETGNGMSEYTDLNSSTKRYYFLLGYRL